MEPVHGQSALRTLGTLVASILVVAGAPILVLTAVIPSPSDRAPCEETVQSGRSLLSGTVSVTPGNAGPGSSDDRDGIGGPGFANNAPDRAYELFLRERLSTATPDYPIRRLRSELPSIKRREAESAQRRTIDGNKVGRIQPWLELGLSSPPPPRRLSGRREP
jgi:hypothetical protein